MPHNSYKDHRGSPQGALEPHDSSELLQIEARGLGP
jgi:hypothetical protein